MLGHAVIFAALGIATVSDIRTKTIPDTVHLLLLLSGAIWITVYGHPTGTRVAAFFTLGALMLFVGFHLGGGDIKMVACLSFALGFIPALLVIALGFSFAVLYMVLNKRFKSAVPLAPFLSAGYIAVFAVKITLPNILLEMR